MMIPLTQAPVGQRMKIRHIRTHPEVCTRLMEMGFCENAIIRCVTRGHASLICEVCNTRIGLNHTLAGDIVVTALES